MAPPQLNLSQQTLAKLLSNSDTLKKWIESNPGANRIRTFLFHRSQLKADEICSKCELDIATTSLVVKINDRELLDGTDNFIWCITCDGLEHLSCVNLTTLNDHQAPWICTECRNDTHNEAAVDLVKDGKVGHSLERRLLSIRAEPADPYEYEEVMSFFMKSLNIDFTNGTPNLKQLKDRFVEQDSENQFVLTFTEQSGSKSMH